jgi:hypothetical protein
MYERFADQVSAKELIDRMGGLKRREKKPKKGSNLDDKG